MRWFYGLLAAVCLFLIWQAVSAGIALERLVSGARNQDGAAILRYTDLPAVRKSLTQQVFAAYAQQFPGRTKVTALEKALTGTLGTTLIDAYLAQIVTAENISRFLRDGTLATEPRSADSAPALLPDRGLPDLAAAIDRLSVWSPLDIAVRTSAPDADYSGIRLRSNALGWRLSGIDLPADSLKTIVSRVRGP